MKKLNILFMAFLLLFGMCGCRPEKTENPPVPVPEVMSNVLKSIGSKNLDTTLSYKDKKYGESFESLYSFSEDMITDGSISYASTGGYADEISMVFVGSRKNLTTVKDAFKNRVDSRILTFNGYKPEEVKKLNQAEVFTEGQYVILIVSSDTLTVKAAVQAAIQNNESV